MLQNTDNIKTDHKQKKFNIKAVLLCYSACGKNNAY